MLTSAGNKISTQTGIGTAIAIAGVAIYSLIKANLEEQKRVNLDKKKSIFLSLYYVSLHLDAMILKFHFRKLLRLLHLNGSSFFHQQYWIKLHWDKVA